VGWRRLLGEGQIRIAGLVGRLHGDVAGERRRDTELLLLPVHVRYAVAGRRLDQSAQPDRGPKDVFRIARLIASGA